MGLSPNAYLVYGFSLGNEDDLTEELQELTNNWEARVFKAFRPQDHPVEPAQPYPDLFVPGQFERREPTAQEAAIVAGYEAAWAADRELFKRLDVDLVFTGSDLYKGYILGIHSTQLSVEWTETEDATKALERNTAEDRDILQSFCKKMGIPFSPPTWLLATRYW